MKRALVGSAVAFAIIAAFLVGLKVGFDKGMVHSFYVDAPARGVLATQQLNALRSGKANLVVTQLEFNVDQSILWHNDFLNSPWVWLLGSDTEAATSKSEEFMRRIAKYRQSHPSPTEPTMFDTVPKDKEQYREEYQELAQAVREHRKIIDSIVARYARE